MRYATHNSRHARWLRTFSTAAALVTLLTVAPLPSHWVAAQNQSSLPSLTDWQQAGFTPKVNTSADRTTSGATRGPDAETVVQDLIALVPDHNAFGITVTPSPNLLVYLPAASGERIVRLELEEISTMPGQENLNKKLVYAQEWQVNGESGLMQLQLPANLPDAVRPQPLMRPNQDYNWVVIVYDENDTLVGMVEGYISYVPQDQVNWQDPQTLAQLNQLSPYEQGTYLFMNYVWYDGVAALAQAYQANPQGVAADWQRVLEVSGLDANERQLISKQMLNGRRAFITGESL